MVERLPKHMETTRFLIDIKIIEKRVSIAHDTKYPAADAALASRFSSKIEFYKMEHNRILIASIDGKRIREVPIPFSGKPLNNSELLGTPDINLQPFLNANLA